MKNVTITEKKLLELLNKYLKANSEARRLQTDFENALAAFSGIEREELSMVMDTYIDFDIAGVPSATLIDLKKIIAQSTKQGWGSLI